MSYAHVQGTLLGSHSKATFDGRTSGIAIGSGATLLSTIVSEGTHIFSLNASVFTSNLTHNMMDGEALVTYGGVVVGKSTFQSITSDDICITGLVFSDGLSEFAITVTTRDSSAIASAVSWGYTNGTVDFVRISAH